MSELGELLELLHGARRRYRTVHGVLRHSWRMSLAKQAQERWTQRQREAGHGLGTTMQVALVGAEPSDRAEQVMRFWSEPPDRVREEAETIVPERSEHLTVRDGNRWWTYSPEWGAVSNVGVGEEAESVILGGGALWQALLDPAGWIAVLDFDPHGEVELLGRRAIRVSATGREPSDADAFLFRDQLPVGADTYELLVDRERGTVLRAAALFGGEEFWVCEFEQLVFDEDLAPTTFGFEPPAGEEIRGPEVTPHEPVTIEEAAQRASFPVFYVPELPEGRWDLHAMYSPARQRPPMKDAVHLVYTQAGATHNLMVTERAVETHEPDLVAYGRPAGAEDELERDGVSFTVYRPERRHPAPLTIVFEREGTAIQLSSQNLDEQTLLDLASSMRTFP